MDTYVQLNVLTVKMALIIPFLSHNYKVMYFENIHATKTILLKKYRNSNESINFSQSPLLIVTLLLECDCIVISRPIYV